ncbi:TIGR03943 family putative permease subunit [Salinithrix halophila]
MRILICFGTSLLLMKLAVAGELGLYVNPRFHPFVLASTVILILMGLIQIWHFRQPALHRTGKLGTLVLLFPLAAAILFPPSPLDADMASKKGVQYLSPEAMNQQQQILNKKEAEIRKDKRSPDSPSNTEDGSAPEDGLTEKDLQKAPDNRGTRNPYYGKILRHLQAANVITLENDNYIDRLTTIQMYNQELKGKPVRVKGFVFRADNMPGKTILLGRYAMTCCAADASVIGPFAHFPGADGLKEGEWIEVQGRLDEINVEGSLVPVIRASSYQKIKAPKDPYVYATY